MNRQSHIQALEEKVFSIGDEMTFQEVALAVFRYQYENNQLYASWCAHLGVDRDSISKADEIPFLPIQFFRTHKIVTGTAEVLRVFSSSGTTGSIPGQHHLVSEAIYIRSFMQSFRQFYGNPADYCILALLPSYLEREGSSLVFMADHLIRAGNNPLSGFYLHNYEDLVSALQKLKAAGQKTMLLGVTFALLELAEKYPMYFPELTIVETGGMKGRGREPVREEVHGILKNAFGVAQVHSEYGMTELLSQAWSCGQGLFACPSWMRILVRDTNDPLSLVGEGKTGGINVIDLANLHSCAFIATQDLGKLQPDGRFEVLGRFDHSEVRGCNLMAVM